MVRRLFGYFLMQEHPPSIALALGIIPLQAADEIQGEFYRRMLCAAAPFDRRDQWIGARRNTLMWTYIPFVVTGHLYEGLVVLTVYTVISFFVRQWRVIVNARRVMEAASDILRANFRETDVLARQEKAGDDNRPAENPARDASARAP